MLKPKKSKLFRTTGAFKAKSVTEKDIEREKKRAEKSFMDRTVVIREKHITEHNFYLSKVEEIGLPEPGETLRIRTQAEMNMFTFILHIIQEFGVIEELYITTYTMNQKTTSALFDFFDRGIIKKLHLAISESYSFRIPKMYETFKTLFNERRGNNNLNMCFFWVHGKLNLIKTKDHHFVFEGSGNFSSNAQSEFYVLSNSKRVYDQDASWMNEFMFTKQQNKRHEVLA